jgi:hypothetical protein
MGSNGYCIGHAYAYAGDSRASDPGTCDSRLFSKGAKRAPIDLNTVAQLL